MPELKSKAPLAGVAPLRAGGHVVTPREDVAVLRLPGEQFVLGAETATGMALVEDMSAGVVCIEISGPEPLEVLGIGGLRFDTAATTRLADLRVTLFRRNTGLLLVADRFSAAYLWAWLQRQMEITAATA